MKLVAIKTFSAGGSKLTMQGETFSAPENRAKEYIRLGLAEEDRGETQAPREMDAEFATEITPNLRADNPEDMPLSDYTEEELLRMNMTELKKIAKNIGVTGYSTMSKGELVFAIRARQQYNQTEA